MAEILELQPEGIPMKSRHHSTVHLLIMHDLIMYISHMHQILAEPNGRHHPKYPLIMHNSDNASEFALPEHYAL